jgi:clan AA aspartic protease (TIGR02281 family)
MNKTILFSVLLLFSNLISAQNSKKNCKEELINGNVKLLGCIDVEGNLHGYGTYTLEDGSVFIEGEWNRGKLNGKGRKIFISESQTQNYNGLFKNDILIDGDIKTEFDNGDILNEEYETGKVVKTKYSRTDKSGSLTQGEHYKSGKLKNGIKKDIYVDNSILSSVYKNGEVIDEKLNTNNYYIKNDIIGTSESINIPLEIEQGDDTMYVSLNIPTKNNPDYSARFIFDTGAESFSIGYRLFNDLKEKGLEYEDLNVDIATVGVSGVSFKSNAIVIKELKIGDYTIKNVVAIVRTLESANTSLLGMGFLKKFNEVKWSLIAKELVFYK